jgi:hypothetical protein
MVVLWEERADSVAARTAGTMGCELVLGRWFKGAYTERWGCCVFLRVWTE